MAKRPKVNTMLALAILSTVTFKPMHPYEMATAMRERGKDQDMDIKWGSLYTVVSNLEKHGFLAATGSHRLGGRPERTVHAITDAGRYELPDWAAAYDRRMQAVGLGVTPTPDDGIRRSSTRIWDESQRPSAPPPPVRAYSESQREAGQHLVDVHDHLRGELATILDLVGQVSAGAKDPGGVRSAIHAMTLRQNNWTLGAYCASYCRLLTTHHTLEDIGVFPQLRVADPGLSPVLDRLAEEHHAIHEVLERVDRALVGLVTSPSGMAELQAAVDLLSDALLSHLSYEERELVEPLARLTAY